MEGRLHFDRKLVQDIFILSQPDRLASRCDNFYCHVKFSIFGRRHVSSPNILSNIASHSLQHCRKCGGVFCSSCTSRAMPLLDTSNLGFLHPPRNVPLAVYESPSSPIYLSRVCDDCWEQVHGQPTPRTPDVIQSL